jgi:hypothetical protein
MPSNRNFLFVFAILSIASIAPRDARADGIVDPGLTGTTQYDAWSTTSLTSAANPGFPGFPGTGTWPGGIGSSSGGDADLTKVANGVGGAPYPAGGSMYYGGFSGDFNLDGGTLAVVDQTTVADLANVVLQVQIGEAWTYDFFNDVLPVLSYNGGAQALAATYSIVASREYVDTVQMPTGPEDVFKNTYLLQWDLTGLAEAVTSLSIQFTGVQHAQLYGLRLDQSDVYTSLAPAAVPEPASMSLLFCGVAALAWRLRKRA